MTSRTANEIPVNEMKEQRTSGVESKNYRSLLFILES